MNSNITFNADGITSGMEVILDGFGNSLGSSFVGDVLPIMVTALTVLVAIVGTWYGVRAILRAMRSAR